MRKLAASAALVLVAGCGSTVQVSSTTTPGAGGIEQGAEATAPGPGASTGTTGPTGSGVNIGPASRASAQGRSTEPPTLTLGITRGTSAAGPVSGPGFTKTTVEIGISTADDYNSFVGGTGLKGLSVQGDPNTWFAAVVRDINEHGGLLGRKIVLVPHDYNTAQTLSDPASANQAACTTWTQDHKVFAVLAPPIVEDTLLSCLKKTSTPLLQVGAGLDYPLHYSETYAKYPLYFNLAQMAGDRFDAIAIARLVARRFFVPWDTSKGQQAPASAVTKIGIISFDDHDGALQLASLSAQLRAHGLQPAITIACPRSLSDKVSCEQSAVLKFRSGGITHIINADSTFMNNANSQAYYPRYFLPIEPATFAANVPAKELNGAMSEGYIPFVDVPADHYPGDPTPATTSCKRLMKAAGQATTDPTTLLAQMSVCDAFYFLRDAVVAAQKLGAQALTSGLERLGSRAPSALTYKTFLGPDHHASAAALRDLVYRSDIQNFVYVSKTDYGD